MSVESSANVDRRKLLCSVAGAGLIAAALAACSDGNGSNGSLGDKTSLPTDALGVTIAKVADIAVGSGEIVSGPAGAKIVVVQPTAGTFKAFSAICTHQGTIVNPPNAEGVIVCPNHGSQFSDEDGSVLKGPAAIPLPSIAVKVEGDNIVLA